MIEARANRSILFRVLKVSAAEVNCGINFILVAEWDAR
jgi:hypothetical protein